MKYLTADEVATALVAACKLQGENPIKVASRKKESRARWYAFAALVDLFPDVDYRSIAHCVGFPTDNSIIRARGYLKHFRTLDWWDEPRVKVVKASVACLVDPVEIPRFLPAARPWVANSLPIKSSSVARRRDSGATAAILGDPSFERSALAQRQTEKVAS